LVKEQILKKLGKEVLKEIEIDRERERECLRDIEREERKR